MFFQALAQIRRDWKPSHKPWFNDKCAESFSNLVESATSQGLDLGSKAPNFKIISQQCSNQSQTMILPSYKN